MEYIDSSISQAEAIAVNANNDNKIIQLSEVKFCEFKKIFHFQCQGKTIYNFIDGTFITKRGDYVQTPDSISYTIKAKIEDNVGNRLWCTLFDKPGEKLFGISATDLWNQVKKFKPDDKSWKKQLIKEIEKFRVNLAMRCRITSYNDSIDGKQKMHKTWIVDELKSVAKNE